MESVEGPKDSKAETERLAKVNFFNRLALKYLPEMRLVFRGGKLWKKEQWRNVAEHCLVQVAAIEVLAEILQLPEQEKNRLAKVAACHDWKKRLERAPQDFTDAERQQAEKFLAAADIDDGLFQALTPEFNERALKNQANFAEKLQWYVDDIAKGSSIVPFDERIDEVEARRQDLNEDVETTARLGGKRYWDAEREIGHQFEKELFEALRSKGVEIDSPEDIPRLINHKLEERIVGKQ